MLLLLPGGGKSPATQDKWDYYMSGNLPGSTALYGIFQAIAHGSPLIWRLLFILGDVAILFGLIALVRVARGSLRDATDQIAILFLVALNPILVLNGTALPEDKQFQTALMLFAAALLLSPRVKTVPQDVGTGVMLGLSVLFKMFGVFLFPLWLARAWRDWRKFGLWTVVGGCAVIALCFLYFGGQFVQTMGSRAAHEGGDVAQHASPWVLLPWLSGSGVLLGKIAVALVGGLGLCVLLARRKIDLLNFCAGLA